MTRSSKKSSGAASSASLKGDLFLSSGKDQSFDSRQVALLRAIQSCGSISAAAKDIGISYKTAWDRVNAMNNLADQPLVERIAGGAQGGGTRLTSFGAEVLAGLEALQAEHEGFLARLGETVQDISDLSRFFRNTNLRTSARNQFRGKITEVTSGTVNCDVHIGLSDSVHITATITHDSYARMELDIGSEVIALIKSSWVELEDNANGQQRNTNELSGTITQFTEGEDGAEVTIDLGDEKTLCAVVDADRCASLKLTDGKQVKAWFNPSSVILMRP